MPRRQLVREKHAAEEPVGNNAPSAARSAAEVRGLMRQREQKTVRCRPARVLVPRLMPRRPGNEPKVLSVE